ncbi:MAG: hypothetical protein GY754_09255 [bacterium]|nr:hypothetical protein [bacterium]
MKKPVTLILTCAFLTVSWLSLDARTRAIKIKLKGRTNTMRTTIPSRRATVRFKQEGAKEWAYQRTVYLKARKQKRGYVYSFKINARVNGKVGKNIIAEAFAKLNDGREVYKEWKIKVSKRLRTLRTSTILSQYRGKGIKKDTPAKKEETLVQVRVNLYGKTPHMEASIPDKKITVKMKYSGQEDWLFNRQMPARKSRDEAGTTYTFSLRARKKLVKEKTISIEASAKLNDGREIFGILETKVLMPQRLVQTKITLDKYRGEKSAEAVALETNLVDIVLKGNISISGRIIKRLKRSGDGLPENSAALVVLKDEKKKTLQTLTIKLTPDKYKNYQGQLTGLVKLPPKIKMVKIDTTVATKKGKKIYRKNQTAGFKTISGKKTLWLRLNPKSVR